MQLDKETVENSLQFLSKAKFDGVCRIILSEYFHLDPVNVDRRGDGGGDWITIPYRGGKRAFIAQATIQDSWWKSKCMEDAEKAVKNFECNRYLFLTSRRRDSVDLLEVENQIQEKHDIPASCLGAVEIADILVSRNLAGKAFAEAGLAIGAEFTNRLDKREQLLFGALAISEGAAALREQVYDDAIVFTLASTGPSDREKLISATIETLQCGEHREGRISGRVDSLLTRGALSKDSESNLLGLSDGSQENLGIARALYDEQFSDLQTRIEAALAEIGVEGFKPDSMPSIAILAARAMILGTIQQTGEAGVSINNTALLDQLGDPLSELKNVVKGACKSIGDQDTCIEVLLEVSNAHPLVLRLSHEILYFALDGVNPLHQAKALGVGSWDEAEAALDASVAIPYLCSRITSPSSGRFSRGATSSVAALQRVGCELVIPRDYLNEAAAHLVRAIDYCRTFDDSDVLVASPNGYVSHYYTLRKDGTSVPNSLIEFLLILAPSIRQSSNSDIVTNVMSDLQGRFADLGVRKIDLGFLNRSFLDSAQHLYRKNMRGGREPLLIEHDTKTIAWMKVCRAKGETGKICLTWDELMMAVARDDSEGGWVVSPHQISDLITMGSRRNEGALLSVAHELASTRSLQDNLVGKLVDEVIAHARAGRLEWEVLSDLSQLRKSLHDRAISEGPPSQEELQTVSTEFWERHGIETRKRFERPYVTQEELERALESVD